MNVLKPLILQQHMILLILSQIVNYLVHSNPIFISFVEIRYTIQC